MKTQKIEFLTSLPGRLIFKKVKRRQVISIAGMRHAMDDLEKKGM